MIYADYSYIARLAECARASYYEHELQLVPKVPNVSLHVGRVIHAGLYDLQATGDIESAVAVMHELYGAFAPPPDAAYMTAGHCEIVLRNYAEDREHSIVKPLRVHTSELQHDRLVDFHPSVDDEGYVVFAETPMAVRIDPDDDEFVYAGVIDLPAQVGGGTYIVDYKTTRQWITERWARKYSRSYQMKGYVAMMQAALGRKIDGVYIDGVYVGKEAADPKTAWTRRTSSRNQLFGPYMFSEEQVEETMIWARRHLENAEVYREYGESLRARGLDPALAWPQNDRACDFCAFSDICHTNPALRESMLRMRFRERELNGILASGADAA